MAGTEARPPDKAMLKLNYIAAPKKHKEVDFQTASLQIVQGHIERNVLKE
jgi:hypothetical protein